MQRETIMKRINKKLKTMPYYIQEYCNSKLSYPYSICTIDAYLNDFQIFLKWMINEKLTFGSEMRKIKLDELNSLKKRDVENYLSYRRLGLMSKELPDKQTSQTTVIRNHAALRSLFKYLSEETENEYGDIYLEKNVMRKVKLKKVRDTLNYRAAKLKGRLLLENDPHELLNLVEKKYESHTTSDVMRWKFLYNKKRDLAILALFLATGIRKSELIDTNVEDLVIEDKVTISVYRKEGKFDVVGVAPFAKRYLIEYLAQREKVGHLLEGKEPLFVTKYSNQIKRISDASVDSVVTKYTAAFNVRATSHDLRHSFATNLYRVSRSSGVVATQLGHNSTMTTDLYVHLVDEEIQEQLEKL